MSKYIDAEKLKATLETRIAAGLDGYGGNLKWLLEIIDSLQQEQQEVDYEKDLTEWMEAGPHTCYPWCTIPDAIKITAEHFYELGLKTRKNE